MKQNGAANNRNGDEPREGFRRVCAYCGKEFWARHPGARYCSAACKQAAYRRRKKRRDGINA